MKPGLSFYYLTFLFILFTALLSDVTPSCEIVDSQLVRDPDICFQSCKKVEGKELCRSLSLGDDCQEAARDVCEWKCTPAPKRYVEVRTCCPGYKNSTVTGRCEEINGCDGVDGKKPPCQDTCINLRGSYKCACSDGLHLASDGHSCQDNDECASNVSLCRYGKCVNTEGSYRCDCPPGRRLSDDGSICIDNDECALNVSLCRYGKCINTEGSYRCDCPPGRRLSKDGTVCIDVDECEFANCSQHCVNTEGSYQCLCEPGFYLANDSKTCEDIDECADPKKSPCPGICVNTMGSYHCDCPRGYRLGSDGYRCYDIDECEKGRILADEKPNLLWGYNGVKLLQIGHNCEQRCVNIEGSFRCECVPGFSLASDGKSCEDVNECAIKTHKCAGICINTKGSYQCACHPGYLLASDNFNCTDIDECKEGLAHCDPDIAKCINVPGSFHCSCKTGFTLSDDGYTCLDKDECQDGTATCAQFCENTYGSFTCKTCQPGYRFENRTCFDIDECQDETAKCQEFCTNTPGSFFCSCSSGFELAPDHSSCHDINECASVFPCSHICENKNGSYTCTCPDYMVLSTDNSTCIYVRYADFFNAGVNRILGIIFISIVAILAMSIVARIAHRQCRSQNHLIVASNSQVEKFIVSQTLHKSSHRKLRKLDDKTSFGHHLAVPAIDEDLTHQTSPENDKLI